MLAPCEPWDLDATCGSPPVGADEALIEQMQAISTDLLWAASGRRFGLCDVSIRPHLLGGDPCVEGLSECIAILPGPVAAVTEVMVDGVILGATEYRLDVLNEQWALVRTDGQCWPDGYQAELECTDEDTFCVTYEKGIPLSATALWAHTALTYELVRSCLPNCDCRLPRNATSKIRKGVRAFFDVKQDWIRSLFEVAAWLDEVNPSGLRNGPKIRTPDVGHNHG